MIIAAAPSLGTYPSATLVNGEQQPDIDAIPASARSIRFEGWKCVVEQTTIAASQSPFRIPKQANIYEFYISHASVVYSIP